MVNETYIKARPRKHYINSPNVPKKQKKNLTYKNGKPVHVTITESKQDTKLCLKAIVKQLSLHVHKEMVFVSL